MKILGIDPGTATSGYGVIDVNDGIYSVICWGLIETSKEEESAKRLEKIFKELNKIIKDNKPDEIAIESLFFARNAKTAIRVGQAQGVMLLSAARSKLKILEYPPGLIKKTVAGFGRAEKPEIQKAVRKFLGKGIRSKIKKRTHFDNAADALAVAICHYIKTNPPSHKALEDEGGD